MVQDSLDQKIPIAIGLVDDPQSTLMVNVGEKVGFVRDVVGYGFPQVIENRPDGTILILLPGQGKARLGKLLNDSNSYLEVEAEPIPEDLQMTPATSSTFLTLQKLLLSWLQENIQDSRAREEFRRHLKTPDQVVGCVAAYLVQDPDLQQVILEANDLDAKVNLLSGMIAAGAPSA